MKKVDRKFSIPEDWKDRDKWRTWFLKKGFREINLTKGEIK